MTKDFEYMLHLFACGATGEEPEPPRGADLHAVCRCACIQHVWPVVFLAVNRLYESSKLDIEPELFDEWKTQALFSAVQASMRNYAVHKLLALFEREGIEYAVLKGEAIASLYADPACRLSSDTDILIDPKDEKKAIGLMKKFGFEVFRKMSSNHTEAEHPEAGRVELHTALYGDVFEDVWFENIQSLNEPYRKIKLDDGRTIMTLGVNDGLIFTALHYVKHFLYKGAGVRQLMDLLLYMKRYKNEADPQRFKSLLESLKYDKFIENSIGIGIEYFKFNLGDFYECSYDPNILERILTDMESGGVFGKNEAQRSDFHKTYTKERYKRTRGADFEAFMDRIHKRRLVGLIFPDKRILEQKYPYVNKGRIFIPLAWAHRILRLFVSIIKREKNLRQFIEYHDNEHEQSEAVKRRMDLIRDLDMI